MSEDTSDEDIFEALTPLRGDLSSEVILDAFHAGRAEREIALFRAVRID
jgi:hypothetical protein